VAAFLAGRLPFLGIAEVVTEVLERHRPPADLDLDAVLGLRAVVAWTGPYTGRGPDHHPGDPMTSLLGITLFVLALMLAIFLHEGGHFTTAKMFGMKVERFFLGFGPTVWSFRRGETEYGIKALPLGGFCKIAGMSPYENDGNFLEEDRSADRGAEPTPPSGSSAASRPGSGRSCSPPGRSPTSSWPSC
jgi:hypothetical protein